MTVRYDIREALTHYRYLAAFIENAVDAMDWYLEDYKFCSQIRSITASRLETMTYKAHIDRALETYGRLCEKDGNKRPYEVVLSKFVDPGEGADGHGRPFSNTQLAEKFGCSVDTIKRDLRSAYDSLAILFFGFHGMPSERAVEANDEEV